MLIQWLFVVLGLSALILGAEALVRGAGGIALSFRMTPAVVALTVVAAGTSMPELVVSTKAAFAGNPGLSLGNAVGSNFLNLGLVLGLTAMIRPLLVGRQTIRFEWPVMMMATLLFYVLARDGGIDRVEGAVMTLSLAAFMSYAVFLDKKNIVHGAPDEPLHTASFGKTGAAAILLNSAAAAVGIGFLALGANLLVKGAIAVASHLGVSDTIIGLTIVAVGTSAPELVTSVVAAARGRGDMAVGNIIGSCVFNLMGILGVTALIKPLSVPGEIIARDTLWLICLTAALFPMMWSGKRLNRIEGALLFGGFAAYTAVLITGA